MRTENLGGVIVHFGDCREVMPTLSQVDSIVCDPPYHLTSIVKRFGKPDSAPAKSNGATGVYGRASSGFMGCQWDGGDVAFDPETWRHCFNLLKPGGHLVAFGSTRTYHRLACAIEDAGFEIRDTLFFLYGSGFPKSFNVGKKLDAQEERCSCVEGLSGVRRDVGAEEPLSGGSQQDLWSGLPDETTRPGDGRQDQEAEGHVCDLRQDGEGAGAFKAAQEKGDGALLQQPVLGHDQNRTPESDIGQGYCSGQPGEQEEVGIAGPGEQGVEGRGDLSQAAGQLRERQIHPLPAGSAIDGQERRLCDGAPIGDGQVGRPPAEPDGSRASCGPRSSQQSRPDEPRIVAGQPESQAGGAWPLCDRCGKPIIPDGLGTALKPAVEPIVLARKPLVGTVAANVLQHGTGALNIDGCRIEGEGNKTFARNAGERSRENYRTGTTVGAAVPSDFGRWPANLIHDGSEEVVGMFPADAPSGGHISRRNASKSKNTYGNLGCPPEERVGFPDAGSAARFFYCSKADSDDRAGSKHPTVKPVDLMRWLVRLVTPKGGTVLDPFAGTGTTGQAALMEGMKAILIEREAGYSADIQNRMAKPIQLGGLA